MPRNRKSARSDNDWLMQSMANKIATMESSNKPPVQEKDAPWWQTGLKAAAPLLIRAIGSGQFKPEGGAGYTGIEGSMARAMKSKAKAMEDEGKLKEEIKAQKQQQYNQRNAQILNALINLKKMKAELGQQTWERGFREKQLQQEKDLAAPKELTPEEKQEVADRHAESMARRANVYDQIKNRNKKDPRLQALDDTDQLFKETSKNKTSVGQLMYGNIEVAWNNFLETGDISQLEDIRTRLLTAPVDVFSEQTQELSPTGEPLGFTTQRTKPAPDKDNLNRLVNGLLRKAKAFSGDVVFQGQPTTQKAKYPETKEGAQKAFADGNYDEASRIAAQIGMPTTEF